MIVIRKSLMVALFGLAMVVAPAARASLTDTYGPATTNWANKALVVDQFNPGLGTLTAVHVAYSSTVDSSFKLTNTDAQPATVTATSGAVVTLTGGPLGLLITLSPSNSTVVNLAAYQGGNPFAPTPPDGIVIPSLVATDSNSVTLTSASALAAFTGAGSFTFTADATANSAATGAGNLVSIINTTAGATVTVSYDYTPTPPPSSVPEPTTLASAGLGLGLLVMAARRRRVAA